MTQGSFDFCVLKHLKQLFARATVEFLEFAWVLWVAYSVISDIFTTRDHLFDMLSHARTNTVMRALALVFSMPQWLICNSEVYLFSILME